MFHAMATCRAAFTISAAAIILASGTPACRADEVAELLSKLPGSANAVAVVHVGELISSRYGRQQGWIKDHASGYAAGLMSAPPSTVLTVRGARLQFGTQMEPETWALFLLRRTVTIGEIARHEKGVPEKLGNLFAVLSERNCYFVGFNSKLIGAITPANHQELVRWVRQGEQNQPPAIDPYLVKSVETGSTAQVAVAILMRHMLDPVMVGRWIAQTQPAGVNAQSLAAADWLSRLEGVRVLVRVSDKIEGDLYFDFDQPPPEGGALLRGPILAFFDDAGARVDRLAQAAWTVEGSSLKITTPLDETALRRILSIIQSPVPAVSDLPAADAAAAQTPAPSTSAKTIVVTPAASSRYYQSVALLIADLERGADLEQGSARASDYLKTAAWHDSFAQRIEQMPRAGVDPELLAWGARTAARFRALANLLRGVPVQVKEMEQSIRSNVSTWNVWSGSTPAGRYYTPWAYRVDTNLPEVRAAQTQAVAGTSEQREEIWGAIIADRSAIRQSMLMKYDGKFLESP